MVKRIVAGHLINGISQCTDICQGTVHLKKALLRSLTSPADIQKRIMSADSAFKYKKIYGKSA